MDYIQGTLFSRMSQDYSQVTMDGTLLSCSENSQGSLNQLLPMCLSLKKGGQNQAFYWSVAGGTLLTELMMRNTGESPNEEKESHLLQILEDKPHGKYFLSPVAAKGILKRAKNHGRKLPQKLETVLNYQAQKK